MVGINVVWLFTDCVQLSSRLAGWPQMQACSQGHARRCTVLSSFVLDWNAGTLWHMPSSVNLQQSADGEEQTRLNSCHGFMPHLLITHTSLPIQPHFHSYSSARKINGGALLAPSPPLSLSPLHKRVLRTSRGPYPCLARYLSPSSDPCASLGSSWVQPPSPITALLLATPNTKLKPPSQRPQHLSNEVLEHRHNTEVTSN